MLLASAGLAAVVIVGGDDDLPTTEAAAYARAWGSGEAAALTKLTTIGSGAAAGHQDFRDALRVANTTVRVTDVRRNDTNAAATVTATHELRGLGEWRVESKLRLVKRGIGQRRVVTTPAHATSVAAAALTGQWRAPFLVDDEAGVRPTAAITPAAITHLTDFMTGVVREGTARLAAAVPGLTGKTGTAEFGTGTPPATHAWFVGARKGVAFAVLLEGGGVGGRDAAPIAARFALKLG